LEIDDEEPLTEDELTAIFLLLERSKKPLSSDGGV
jgi:hypothetical protein